MKYTKLCLGLVVFLSSLASVHADAINNTDFVMTWRTTTANEQIIIPIVGGSYNIDCNDDGDSTDTGDSQNVSGDGTCTFATVGDHQIRLSGTFPHIKFEHGDTAGSWSNRDKLISIDQWGTNPWTSMNYAFYKCTNLEVNAPDTPNLTNVTDMSGMFSFASSVGGTGSTGNWNWDTRNVTDMEAMFHRASSFNQLIEDWNTSSVTTMGWMFNYAYAFNQPIGNWDTSNVTRMNSMFAYASVFNQPIGNWNTNSVTNMGGMFRSTSAFNQPIGNWDTSNVTNMRVMFDHASTFNQPIGNWDTRSVTDMYSMFKVASSFNQPIENWNTNSVTDMGYMFAFASSFNQDLSNWDISSVQHNPASPDNDYSFQGMFHYGKLSTSNYDALLISFYNQVAAGTANQNLIFDGGNSNYCSQTATDARNSLINDYGWTITDGGRSCTPTDITLSNNSVAENTTAIGNFSTTDLDGGSHNYTLVSGTGAEDNNKFTLTSAGILSFTTAPDYETPTDSGATVGNNTYSILVRTTDARNNTFEKVFIVSVTDVDDTPPTAPSSAPDLVNASDTGVSNTDNITSDTTPTFNVVCSEAGSTVTLYIDGAASGSASCTTAGGMVNITPTTTIADGVVNITYTETDTVGNKSGVSPTLSVTIDSTAPSETDITIDSPTMNTPTSNTNTPITGTCGSEAANGTVTITTNPVNGFTTYPATASLDNSGNFNITGLTWNEGQYTLNIVCNDPAGNETTTNVSSVIIDTTAPSIPVCTTTPNPVNNGTDITTTCTGVEDGATVTIPNMTCTPTPAGTDGIVVCTGTVETGPTDISTSDDNVTITDTANNTNTDATTGLVIDNEAPVITLSGGNPDTIIGGQNYTPVDATCSDNVDTTCEVIVTDDIDINTSGDYTITYTATDEAGNTSTITETITVDGIAPTTPSSAPDLVDTSDTGVSNTDNSTSDTTPTFDLVCSEADSTLTVYLNGTTAIATASCTTAGETVTVTPITEMVDGTYNVTYTETDAVGNESEASPSLEITINTTDTDGDNIPDIVDTDDDNDGVLDVDDDLPKDPTETVDTDGDGIGDNADTDDDNDGFSDTVEDTAGTDPKDPNSKPISNIGMSGGGKGVDFYSPQESEVETDDNENESENEENNENIENTETLNTENNDNQDEASNEDNSYIEEDYEEEIEENNIIEKTQEKKQDVKEITGDISLPDDLHIKKDVLEVSPTVLPKKDIPETKLPKKLIHTGPNNKVNLFTKYPTILPTTGVQQDWKKRFKRGHTVDDIFLKNVTIKLPHWSHFMLAGSKNTDLKFWIRSVVKKDRNRDQYIVLPTQGLVMPINSVSTSSTEAQSFFKGSNENFWEYLRDGAVELPGTSMGDFGEVGNKVISGHSSYWKNGKGRYKTHFQRIIEMDEGQEIWVYKKQADGIFKRFVYEVTESYNTDKTDIDVIKPTTEKNLTLFTCTPIGGAEGRWIVKSTLKE